MATVDIVDIAGLVKGLVKGRVGNQFLGMCDIHICCFDNDNIVHVDGNVNPIRDKEIDIELQLKDLENVEKRLKSKTCC
jgi:ribosome-binding ATPase YchF (GTP1/OBG family)